MQTYPPQRSTRPDTKDIVRGNHGRTDRIYFPLVSVTHSRFLLVTNILKCHQRGGKIRGSHPLPSRPASSYYLAASPFVFARLSFIISSQGFTDATMFSVPPIVSSGLSRTPCDKCVASTSEIQRVQGLFLNPTRLCGWQQAQLRPLTLIQHLARS